MGFTTVGWFENGDFSASGLTEIQAISPDGHVSTNEENIQIPTFAQRLAAVFANGPTATRVQISSPTLEAFNQVDVSPLSVALEPLSPTPWMPFFGNPIPMGPGEDMVAQVQNDNSPGGDDMHVIAWLMNNRDPALPLPIRSIRATSSDPSVSNKWTKVQLKLGSGLKPARYQFVGLKSVSFGGTPIAARVNFVGEENILRPGVVASDSEADVTPQIFRHAALGSWGEFEHDNVPQIEILNLNNGETDHRFILDVIKMPRRRATAQ